MGNICRFDTVSDYNGFNNHETLNPLVSIIDFSKAKKRTGHKMFFGLYCIILKDVDCGDLKYGRHQYDYQKGTLVFVSPGQVIDAQSKSEPYQPVGHGLVFHSDLIHGTTLAKTLGDYHFFSYRTSEALHLSEEEQQIVLDCFSNIESELKKSGDKHSRKLIVSNIELFLNYCERFYERQFKTREDINKGILARFEELLNKYFRSDKPVHLGLPSVAFFAEECNLSANYFGDLIKKETGKSPKDHIHDKIVEEAKIRIFDEEKTLSEIAYEMGFKYPQHFTRLFKKRVGSTPNEYKKLN